MQNRDKKIKYSKEDALNTIDRNISWITMADNKSSILLGVLSVLFGGLIFNHDYRIVVEIFINGSLNQQVLSFFILIFTIVTLLSFLCTFVLLFFVILSRTRSYVEKPKKRVTFFNDVSAMKFEDFKDVINEIKEEELLKDLISQVYITSYIASKKYDLLMKGNLSFAIYFGSTFILVILMRLL